MKRYCQIFGLEKRKHHCRSLAQVRVTYPTGPEEYQLWALCLTHYIKCLREDIKHLDEMPDGWVQEVYFIRSENATDRVQGQVP